MAITLPSLSTLLLTLSVLLPPTFIYLLRPYIGSFPAKSPPLVSSRQSWPLLGALAFFTERRTFFEIESKRARDRKGAVGRYDDGNFSFRLAKLHVIGLAGEKAREFFYSNRSLSFEAGYAVLFGSAPKLKDAPNITSSHSADGPLALEETPGHFTKRITALLNKENMERSLARLIEDVTLSLDKLGTEGSTNPFESVYRIVFRLTMRTVGCVEISNDEALLEKVLKLYQDVENSANATTILFPWLPTPSKIKRTVSATKLYMILSGFVSDRKKTGRTEDDALQYLIDQGDSMLDIIEFTIGSLFAGITNSGINAAYVLCYLSLPSSSSHLATALSEIRTIAARHTSSPSAPLHEQLLSLPVAVWESEFEFLDLCLKDSIRLHLQGAALRRNVSGQDVWLGDERVPDGAVLAYHLADIHMDPEVYPDPETWDPTRYLPDRAEDKKRPFGWVGWGAGRHPCLGMRFAKLEQSIIVAFWLARFESSLTDKDGKKLEKAPPLNLEAHTASRPKEEIRLEYKSKI